MGNANGSLNGAGMPTSMCIPDGANELARPLGEAVQVHRNTAPEVYQAICKVAKEISREGIAKGRRNEQQGYGFRGIDDIMNALSALLAGAELLILPRMVGRTQEERLSASQKVLFYVVVHAEFDFVSARDGSTHTVTMYGEAMDSADKATNKAMSAAYKYACLQVFCIPTEAMPDADATTEQPASKPQPAPRPAPARADRPEPIIDTGGHPMGTAAAAQYVGQQKIEKLQAKVPNWRTVGDVIRDHTTLRTEVGENDYYSALKPYGYRTQEELFAAVRSNRKGSMQHALAVFEDAQQLAAKVA